jgi:hypothetical protein
MAKLKGTLASAVPIVVALLVVAPSAAAQTYTVKQASGSSSTSGSLPWAMAQANAAGGANTIDFQSGLGTIVLPQTGLPQITDDGLAIDGCDGSEVEGGCQLVDATGVTTGSAVNGDGTVFDVGAGNVTIEGLKVNNRSGSATPDDNLTLVNDLGGANGLTLRYDTLQNSDNSSAPSNVANVYALGNGLTVGGLNSTHQPQGGVTMQCGTQCIDVEGDDAVVEGDSLSTYGEEVVRVGYESPSVTGVKILANQLSAGADGEYGIALYGGTLTQVGDPTLQATPNSFSGIPTPVFVSTDYDADASSLFFNNVNAPAGSGPFYMLQSGANGGIAPPTISTATPLSVSGTGTPGASVELLNADTGPAGATNHVAGVYTTTTADGSGNWSVALPGGTLSTGGYVTALQTLPGIGSSATAGAVLVGASPRYTVTASVSSGGGGSVSASSPAGDASCSGASCTVDPGDEVELTAHPSTGYEFTGWTGGACSGQTSAKCVLNGVIANDSLETAGFQAIVGAITVNPVNPEASNPFAPSPFTPGSGANPLIDVKIVGGLINPGSHVVNCFIDYGTTPAYGHRVQYCTDAIRPILIASDDGYTTMAGYDPSSLQLVNSVDIGQLAQDQTYHYRVVAVDDSGSPEVDGPDETLTTEGIKVTLQPATVTSTTTATLAATGTSADLDSGNIADWEFDLFAPGDFTGTGHHATVKSTANAQCGGCDTDSGTTQLTGLKPGTTYAYRLRVVNGPTGGFFAVTASQTFTTLGVTVPPGFINGTQVSTNVACVLKTACTGTISYYSVALATGKIAHAANATARTRGLLLAKSAFSVRPGSHASVKAKLNARGRRALGKKHSLKVTEVITETVGHAHQATTTRTITLKRS